VGLGEAYEPTSHIIKRIWAYHIRLTSQQILIVGKLDRIFEAIHGADSSLANGFVGGLGQTVLAVGASGSSPFIGLQFVYIMHGVSRFVPSLKPQPPTITPPTSQPLCQGFLSGPADCLFSLPLIDVAQSPQLPQRSPLEV